MPSAIGLTLRKFFGSNRRAWNSSSPRRRWVVGSDDPLGLDTHFARYGDKCVSAVPEDRAAWTAPAPGGGRAETQVWVDFTLAADASN